MITLKRATGDEIEYVKSLLRRNDLPHADVTSKPECFFIASVDGDAVGIGGLEAFDSVGLLRSIVVEEARRGQDYGAAICDELETEATANGIDTLYLLTTTAAAFFEGRGYEVVDRESAPPTIRRTTQFTDLCPDSAVCMRKHVV